MEAAHDHSHAEHDDKAHNDTHDHSMHEGHEQLMRNRFWICLALTIPVLLYSDMIQMWLGFSMPQFPGSEFIVPVFATIIFVLGGWLFLQMAVPEIKHGKPGMMTLISMGVTVSYVYSLLTEFVFTGSSFFWEMATLIDVMLLGHWLEMRSVRRASSALDELAKLMPDTAERINDDGSTEEVKVTGLHQGDVVLIRPGASVPVDGEVVEGESKLNESMITGESKPVGKGPGDEVIGGTVNGDGSLRIRVKATGDDTALAGIMRLVKEAQETKSETQLLADKAAAWLFWVALSVAALTAVAWIVAQGFNIDVLERVATVLVIACPHALGLAIPLVVAISTSLAAGNGILVRDRSALETARELNVVMFDKTGTLTRGEFTVVDMSVVQGEENEALAITAAVEGDSEHMIAQGIRSAAKEREINTNGYEVTGFEAIKGHGVRANVKGKEVHIGGPRLLDKLNLTLSDTLQDFTERSDAKGYTVVYLVEDGKLTAGFALADAVREESRAALAKLRELGIEVAMITGDSEAVAKSVADELGIDTYFAEVLPENKDQKVKELQQQGKKVAMVGDGVNDAPALARADVGIAIGSGTDVAVESAGIILVKNNPMDVVGIITLSKATHSKMIQNLIWATAYNVLALPLAAGVLAPIGFLLSPAWGAVAMSVSTVAVAVNAQFLRGLKLKAA